MDIGSLLASAAEFEAELGRVKRSLAPVADWYPYGTIRNVWHLERLLTGGHRDLLGLAGGQPVADIGAGDGDLAFFLAGLGATVDIVDHAQTNWNGLRGARMLAEHLGPTHVVSVHDVDLDSQFRLPREQYGLVLLLGILYHLQNPFYVLRHLAERARYMLLSTRVVRVTADGRVRLDEAPVAYLVDPCETNVDSTNYWMFSVPGLHRIIDRSGWTVLDEMTVGRTEGDADPSRPDRDERAFLLLASRHAQAPVELSTGSMTATLRLREATTTAPPTAGPTSHRGGRPRIGLWGTFDVESFGDELARRVTARQLARRLPGAEIVAFSPYGHAHQTRLDGGEPAEPLGPWSPERVAELADGLDCVVVTGDGLIARPDAALAGCYGVDEDEIVVRAPSRFFVDGLGEFEVGCPVVWHGVGLDGEPGAAEAVELRKALAVRPYVALCDEASRRWLEGVGVDRGLVVVPHPAVLASRLFPSPLVEQRLEYLRIMGWYPRDEPALIVQGDGDLVGRVDELAPALERLAADLGGASIVLVEVDPTRGDRHLADALAAVLTRRPFRLPVVGVEDIVASVAGSAAVVTGSAALVATAVSYGRPHAPAGDPGALDVGPGVDRLLELQDELEVSFDRVAALAAEAAARRPIGDGRPDLDTLLSTVQALRRANQAQGRRLIDERLVLADRVSDLTAAIAAHGVEAASLQTTVTHQQRALAAQAAELERSRTAFDQLSLARADSEARLATAECELAALRATRTFRWTAPARSLVAWLRRSAP